MTFLEPSTATSAQPRAELQDAGDENSAVSGICFETAQFRVGDENKTETKQNQPHVSNCQLWLGKGYKGFFLPLLLVVYLKSSVIKRIFSPPPLPLYGLATSFTVQPSGITTVMNTNYTHIKPTFYNLKTLKAPALKIR